MQKPYVPDIPYVDNRVISTRITPEFHKQLRQFAADKDCAVAAIVKTALEVYLGNRAH
jgi:predicted DNA-binding ribbon-helix-helix protein